MLALINEESRFPKGTDFTLLEKLHSRHAVSPHAHAKLTYIFQPPPRPPVPPRPSRADTCKVIKKWSMSPPFDKSSSKERLFHPPAQSLKELNLSPVWWITCCPPPPPLPPLTCKHYNAEMWSGLIGIVCRRKESPPKKFLWLMGKTEEKHALRFLRSWSWRWFASLKGGGGGLTAEMICRSTENSSTTISTNRDYF